MEVSNLTSREFDDELDNRGRRVQGGLRKGKAMDNGVKGSRRKSKEVSKFVRDTKFKSHMHAKLMW